MSSSRNMNRSCRDRISRLPSNIIECILDRMPIHDAVATCVLSKEWTHKWRRLGNLMFDHVFFGEVSSLELEEQIENLTYRNIIGKVLLLHIGPIQKFSLYMPDINDSSHDLSLWMLYLTQKDVEELIIECAAKLRLPSYIYRFSQLQHLKLESGALDLNIPQSFDGFSKLLSLDLNGITNGDELSNMIYSCPLLERLVIRSIKPEEILVIDAPRLRELSAYCPTFRSLQLKNVLNVTKISIRYDDQTFGGLNELMNIFGSVPKFETCTLSALNYDVGMPLKDSPSSLRTLLHNIRSLTLLKVDLQLRRCVSFLLYIIKSSPNLQNLNLQIVGQIVMPNEAALQFLEMQTRKSLTLNSLSLVKMRGLVGDQTELMLIELILSSSPALNTIYLAGHGNLKEVVFLTELLQCPRSSSKARVVVSGYSSVFDF